MAKRRKKKKVKQGDPFKLISGIVALIIVILGILADNGVISVRKIKKFFGEVDSPAVNAQMSVHFIDVGQGDCTLIVSDGEAMLVDAGEAEYSETVADYLDSMGVTKLKYIIGTHPHSDHIGGLAYIIDNYDVETIIMPKIPNDLVPTTMIYENLLETIGKNGKKIRTARNEVLELGTSKVEIFKPESDSSNLNNYSVCVKITHGDNSFLLTGDTEKTAEKDFAKKYGSKLSAKVYKMGHHGSETASSAELLDEVLPRYAIISCAKDNDYGHPHEEAVDRINKYADYTFSTYKEGTIIFESDGKGLSVINTKGESLVELE